MTKRRLIRVFSHPRSGTNLMMHFLGVNFYPGADLQTEGRIGHWDNRQRGYKNPWGMLAGTHYFPADPRNKGVARPAVYIVRDGRAVAWSLYRTPVFRRRDQAGISFRDFLRFKLDWTGSPGDDTPYPGAIAAHWRAHADAWAEFAAANDDVLVVCFEDLVAEPDAVRKRVAGWSGMKPAVGLKLVTEKVGWFPHEGTVDGWRGAFGGVELAIFHADVPRDHWALHDG